MSYFQQAPVQYSQGRNFDMFVPGTHNRMIPQEAYSLNAAGPEYLAGGALGTDASPAARKYGIDRLHPIPANLAGLGADPFTSTMASSIQPSIEPVAEAIFKNVINSSWPAIEAKMMASINKVPLFKYQTAIATGAVVVGGLAAIASIIIIKNQMGK